jgi:hypothetical protein
VIAGAGCGAQQPYKQVRGTPVVIDTRINSSLSPSGFQLALAAQCESRVLDVWCPPRDERAYDTLKGICKNPTTIHKEVVACPRELDFKSVQVSIRAPWGRVYSAISDANGAVEIPLDWTTTGVDPLAVGAAEQIATGWLVYSDEARAIPLKIEPGDTERMLSAIGAATDTQYEVGAANEKAVLSAEFSPGLPLAQGRSGTLSLVVTNSGPQPAYRVIAKLRSGVEALHGHQLSFGRIDPGKTKTKTRSVAIPSNLDERSALVVAEVSYFNGEAIETKKKFDIVPPAKGVEPPRGLAMDCKLATAEVAPGERVRIDCELRNLGNETAKELSIAVSIRGVVSRNLAPQSLPGAASAKLELIGLTLASEQQGAEVPVIVRATALGLRPVERSFSIRIASFATKCKTLYTRDEYKAKRKRLQVALDSGALTQKEFDKYDAALVGCLQ